MIRDRGNIKWQGMMLTEHNVEIKHWLDMENYVERPELDDFDLQAIQYDIELAYKSRCVVSIKSWDKGKITLHSGKIKELNAQSMWITIDSPFGKDRMPVEDIIGVQCLE
ncbi:YolD-like family protein [Sporosarcina sp. FSL K6-1508]|uniref:YolD-like family protein n=1 Tax=Sporosarcina sp. FSL K6-1508 TaxID=2921553 RepID=UPI0030F6A026